MVFASIPFIFLLLPLFLLCDYLARGLRGGTGRNLVMLFASLLFYVWGEVANVFVLLAMGAVNYWGGAHIANQTGTGQRRFWLVVYSVLNLSVLVWFKYAHWMVSLIAPDLLWSKSAMPLGISFFTFHALSYIIDVYRKDIKPSASVTDFMTYFCMFPHLVAGPIVRYSQVEGDLAGRGPGRELFAFGMYRFLIGLNKKVLIANSVAILADSAFTFSAQGGLEFLDAWLGILAYAVQIYFDFSGYSDMAIGLAAMAGFHFHENFKRPYSSLSIREFWRRWHISLSNWLRDYLYIPLGGSRQGNLKTYRNLILVFFICGLWHGANFTFIIWGLWHGIFLVLERLPVGKGLERLPRPLARTYAFLVVLLGWVFFRADSLEGALGYLGAMFSPDLSAPALFYYATGCVALGVGLLLSFIPDSFLPAPSSRDPGSFSFSAYLAQALLAFLSIALLLTGARSPFIYFHF